MKLYEIDDKLRDMLDQAYQIAEENEGEIPDSLETSIAALEYERDQIIDYFADEIANLSAISKAYAEEAKKFAAWKKTADGRVEWINQYLSGIIPLGQKWQSERHKITWRKSQAVVLRCDPENLPEEFLRVKIDANKTAIKAAIKCGEKLDDIAYIEEKQTLSVK